MLLVEDDEDDYVIISDLLSEIEELDLEWVSDYDEALRAAHRAHHQVVVAGQAQGPVRRVGHEPDQLGIGAPDGVDPVAGDPYLPGEVEGALAGGLDPLVVGPGGQQPDKPSEQVGGANARTSATIRAVSAARLSGLVQTHEKPDGLKVSAIS